MSATRARWVAYVLMLSLLQVPATHAAQDDVQLRAYLNDACIVADEPFFVPADASGQTPKFLPLVGLLVGKLAELFVNHEIQASADYMKSRAARRDTRYAIVKEMSLYRADFDPVPTVSLNAKLGCMTIVAANFQPEPAHCTASYAPKELARETQHLPQSQWKTVRTDDSIENQLRRADVCVNGKARAVYEARFEFSSDGTAYRLKDAGYRIDSLLTTRDKGASRTALYTLKISAPGATEQPEVLTSAWVMLGTVAAGAHSSGSGADTAPWLRVPPMSVEARRIYEEKTKVQQDVMGEIEALKRAMTRNQRIQSGLDQSIATATGDVAEGLRQERTKVAVQYQTQAAELAARNAEYRDLPHTPLEFMPVTIEVAVTETESAKQAQLALADLIGSNSNFVASAVGSATSDLISRSVNPADVITEPEPPPSTKELDRTRARYFDALAELKTSSPDEVAQKSRRLEVAKDEYNAARRSLGLEQIK